jgi:hypothetical protein
VSELCSRQVIGYIRISLFEFTSQLRPSLRCDILSLLKDKTKVVPLLI